MDVLAMNVFDLSPAQIRNRLILRARRAALAAGTGRQPPAWPHGHAGAAAVARVPVVPCVSVTAGDVVRLAESDYRYADGPLLLRIVRVRPDLSEWYDGEWVWLEGVEIGPDGQDAAFRPVLARSSRCGHADEPAVDE
ncbi:hypothetical protein [Verrucosispora sp. WMMD1129]|uniref:hypothetical protein n=1 Tax=Verrucosispora sp. WMMD1129 TaxID=3016093 RepID=UPI00249C48E2|nr:hypothetical protein [Verrucosispora sp. WMMD1129]WFE48376.1 hypothetical protein O7624_30440 [Verrucosispora sp. WMMD1129]